jgi:SAM-dependent methyltransferase
MLFEEAQWIKAQLASFTDDQLFPLLNIGSSTGDFRSNIQPHIEQEVFAPLAIRGGRVIHLDIKNAPGVDIVGDLDDAAFVASLREQLCARSILVSNVLEHVPHPGRIAETLVDIVKPGGVIVASGPHAYPYHPDPIDTGFRPTVDEARHLFPQTRLLHGEIIPSPTWRPWGHSRPDRLAALTYYARLGLPFYRPRSWRRQLNAWRYWRRGVAAYGIVLARQAQAGVRG